MRDSQLDLGAGAQKLFSYVSLFRHLDDSVGI